MRRQDNKVGPQTLLTLKEAASLLGVSVAAVRYHIHTRHCPYVMKAGAMWVRLSALRGLRVPLSKAALLK